MNQTFIEGVEPYEPKDRHNKQMQPRRPNSWFHTDYSQLALIENARTPDVISPLAYVGAKHRLYKRLMMDILPANTSEIVSPFMGGASLELKLAGSGMRVWAYDIFKPVVEFFQVFNSYAASVVDKALQIYPIYKGCPETRERYEHIRKGEGWNEIACEIERAATTWCISKQSYMGRNFSSSPVAPEHALSIEYFRNPIGGGNNQRMWADWHNPNISFHQGDFRESLADHDCIAYMDPPYVTKEKLYGFGDQGEFPHEELRDILAKRQQFVLSYGDHPVIWELYQDFKIVRPQWQYGFGKAQSDASQSEELLILSHDLA